MTVAAPAFELQIAELLANSRRARLSRFDTRTLVWLAVIPEWTEARAIEARFSLSADGAASESLLGELLGRLTSAQLIERRTALNSIGTLATAFWMPASIRPEIGLYLRETRPLPELEAAISDAVRELSRIASRGDAPTSPEPLPAAVQRWLEVANNRGDTSGGWLLDTVGARVEAGQMVEARDYVAAAAALGDVLDEPMASAARRARWRIDRGYREAQDSRLLEHYHPRPAFEDALEQLVWGTRDDGQWALHLLGMGGVGKTTLIRYLSSGRFAADRQRPRFPVARIDFDHLDPRYPEQRPAELLTAFVSDLSGFTLSRSALYAMRAVDDAANQLHEALSGASSSQPGDGLLDQAINAFAGYLRELESPVVLVLDTCEELAKLYAPGAAAPGVERTFRILEAVHAAAPGVRVLFAGRRPLSQSKPTASVGVGPLLPPRSYLRVVEVGGFSLKEAGEYFNRRDPPQVVSAALRGAVFERCGERGPVTEGEMRINPFDLAGYCDWVVAEPELDPERIRSGSGDPYVEQRILARLGSVPVRDALPVAVELGRFVQPMIAPELERRAINVEAAFAGLAAQEWVSVAEFTTDGQPRVIEIDEHLRDRIRAVLFDADRTPRDRRRLGQDMAALLRDSPIAAMSREAVAAALRLLPAEEAGAYWTELEACIVEQRAWAWASNVVPFAAAVESDRAAVADGPTIMAAIRATHAAATLRVKGRPGLRTLWAEVAELAGRHPDAYQRALLEARGVCGAVAAAPDITDVSQHQQVLALLHSDVDLPLGTRLAVVDAISPYDGLITGDGWGQAIDRPEIAAAAMLARGVGHLVALDAPTALMDVQHALALVEEIGDTELGDWADWVWPARFRDRARLARLVVAVANGEALDALPWQAWRDEALPHVADIDAERLVSATLTFELAHHVPTIETVEMYRAADTAYVADRRATSWWHAEIAPLCVTVAHALAANSMPSDALTLLNRRREQAVYASDDEATLWACELGMLDLSRMYRTMETELFSRNLQSGAEQHRTEVNALEVLKGSPPLIDADWTIVRRVPPLPDDSGALLAAYPRGNEFFVEPDVADAPPRLAGQLALAQGELVALQRPAQAIELLRIAIERFAAAEDHFGANRAQILHTLAQSRAGLTPTPLRALPPFIRPPSSPAEEDVWWQPWFERLVLANAIVTGKPLAPASRSRSPELDLPPAQAVRQPPVESAQLVAPAAPPPTPSKAPAPVATERRSAFAALYEWLTARLLVAQYVGLIFGLPFLLWGLLIVAVLGGPALIGFLVSLALPSTVSAGTPIAASYALVVLGFGAVMVLRGSRARPRLQQKTFSLAVSGSEVENLVVSTSEVLVDKSGTLWKTAGQFVWKMPLQSGDPLAAFDAAYIPTERLGRASKYLVVPIDVNGHVEWPWEQRLRLNGPYRPLWVRWSGRPAFELPAAWTSQSAVYRGVTHLAPTPTTLSQVLKSAGNKQVASDQGVRVLHLVGTPVPTRAGVRLRVSGAVTQAAQQVTARTQRGEELLDASVLPLRGSGLVIVQADPVDGPPQTLGGLRSELIVFGMSLIGAEKASALLIVPPLPDALARKVTDHIWSRIAVKNRIDPKILFEMVVDLRVLVASAEQPASTGARPSLDVLLALD